MADTCNAHVATFFILTFKVFSYLKIVFAIFFLLFDHSSLSLCIPQRVCIVLLYGSAVDPAKHV